MNSKNIAFLLIGLGTLALILTFPRQERMDFGPMHATVTESRSPVPAALGGLAVVAGVVLLYQSRSRS